MAQGTVENAREAAGEPMFEAVAAQPDYAALERAVLEFWRRERIFERAEARPGERGEFVFFEGPPTANGKPALHHVLARAYKDLVPRYRTMKGHHVTRKGGWDTHGLPVEIAVEKKLEMLGRAHDRSREELEEFNRLCRESVFENIQDWNEFTERLGFWVDLRDPYVTYHNDYIESVWNCLRRLWDKGLVEQDYKVVPLSPRIGTTLSANEIAEGYREVDDPSVYVRLPLRLEATPAAVKAALEAAGMGLGDLENPALLVWTTTPWTLPSNVAVAVGPGLEYVLAHTEGGHVVVAAGAVERVGALGHGELEVAVRLPGAALEGWGYTAPFAGVLEELGVEGETHYVVLGDFVSAEDGTGLVHQAPAYGADDLASARRYGLPMVFGVDERGVLRVTGERGKFFKAADPGLTEDLRRRGLLYWGGTYRHSYPFHDRTDDPILYFAKPSWYVRTSRLRERLAALNREIAWVPAHTGEGRFGNWLENNVDWAISRERYWGTPLPFWRSEDGSRTLCVGSVAELSMLAGQDLSGLDLHRPYVDDVTFTLDGQTYRRVPEVLDVWFDSGAMPYAQWHLLYLDGVAVSGGEEFARHFPADFICEAVDQTRGWFYSLHALAALLYDSVAFKNVISLGHLVDEDGKKMSKSRGNIVEPLALFDRYGADSLRWYTYTASEPGEPKRFSERLVVEAQRGFVNTLWNVYGFFVLYANLDRPDLGAAPSLSTRPEIDRWLVSRLEETKRDVDGSLAAYDVRRAAKALERLADDLSNWYVRLNRRRFWRAGAGADKLAAYATLHEALTTVARLAAPFVPFLAEVVHGNLAARLGSGAEASVHLERFPEFEPERYDEQLVNRMAAVLVFVEMGRRARGQAGLKNRQPLQEVLVSTRVSQLTEALKSFEWLLKEELNVKNIRFVEDSSSLISYSLKPNLPKLGREKRGNLIPQLRKALETADALPLVRATRGEGVVTLDGILIGEGDLLVDARSPEGYAALEDKGLFVAFNTRLTPDLVREGLARDLVRLVQQARKDAGLEVSDAIALRLELSGEALEAARAFEGYLRGETLAASLEYAPPAKGDFVAELEGGRLGLVRA